MKNIFLTIFWASAILNGICQTPADTFKLQSKYGSNGNYIAEVTLPPGYQKEKAYPICYFLDLKLAEPLMKDVSDSLLRNKLVSDYIFVGIKCDDTSRWCGPQRFRDFSPSYNQQFETYKGIKNTGEAPHFLSFLKNELIPLIEGKYKSNPEKRTLFGISFSGLFASYAMLEEPLLFRQYIIGSPSLWYNNFELVNRLKDYNSKQLKSISHVYICVGEKEDMPMILGFNDFSNLLKEKNVNVISEVYQNKNHVGIWKDFLIKGIQSTFPLYK